MDVHLTIDGTAVTASENLTILEAAAVAGIHVPSLCFLKDCNNMAACRMCVVEVAGARTLMPSCATKVRDGMEVRTNSPQVLASRRRTMDLIFRHHNTKCEYCTRYSDCELHAMLRSLGMNEHKYETGERSHPDESTKAIVRDNSKCITCRRCISTCNKVQGIGVLKAFRNGSETFIGTDGPLNESECILCGACIQACPTGALSVYSEMDKVAFALRNKRGRKIVAVISPKTSEKIGKVFFDEVEQGYAGKLISALRLIGFDAVYDRAKAQIEPFCPAVLRYARMHFPRVADTLYTDAEMRPLDGLREISAKQLGVSRDDVFLVSVTPCVSEKGEKGFADAVLTTVETVDLLRHQCVSRFTANEVWAGLESGSFDPFEATGTAAERKRVLGLRNVAEALAAIENCTLNARDVELRACPEGCAVGGGQPRSKTSGA